MRKVLKWLCCQTLMSCCIFLTENCSVTLKNTLKHAVNNELINSFIQNMKHIRDHEASQHQDGKIKTVALVYYQQAITFYFKFCCFSWNRFSLISHETIIWLNICVFHQNATKYCVLFNITFPCCTANIITAESCVGCFIKPECSALK